MALLLQQIDEAIIQYLHQQGLLQTVEAMRDERRLHAINPGFDRRKQNQMDEIMKAFDDGDSSATIAFWDEYLESPPPPKLGFWIQVFFAIYPLLMPKSSANLSATMKGFGHFLEEYSKKVDVAPECLPFYALPFVADPKVHESFSHLFKESWAEDLRLEYMAFLEDHIQVKHAETPLLVTFFSKESHVDDHLDLKFDRLLLEQEEGRDELMAKGRDPVKLATLEQSGSFPVQNLEIARISNVLCSPVSDVRKAELLQALRWNLTQSQPPSVRRVVLVQYLSGDLLQCLNDSDSKGPSDLLNCLLSSNYEIVKDSCLRLISAISNYYSGRNYLLNHQNLTALLCAIMTGSSSSNNDIHLNALCILQKFSMRRGPELQMIDLGVVQYIARILSDYRHLSDETVEFATALLFNLSLRTSGKAIFENNEFDMVSLLIKLLDISSREVRNFICGTFTSILSRPRLKKKAQLLGAASHFKCSPIDSDETKEQIRTILEQLNNTNHDVDESWVSSDQEDDDPDYVSDEEEDKSFAEQFQEDIDDELCEVGSGGLRGAQLLSIQYTCKSNKK